MAEPTGARLRMRRRLRWAETDAAGHHHFSAAVRWLEEAEHGLWCSLGLAELVPLVPRVHLDLDYRERLWFNEEFDVTVGVVRVGRTSCTFGFTAARPNGDVCVQGHVVVTHAPDPRAGAVPWDDRVRALLEAPSSYEA